MRTLSVIEMITICAESNCPVCHKFMAVETKITEENLITTSGTCHNCNKDFMVDRTYPVPYELVGGHEYARGDN